MAEYIDIDKAIVVTDTRGRERETTVRHILDLNKGAYKDMKNIPYYVPEICDGHYCPMDCEDGHCPWADEAMEYIMEMEDDEDGV